MKIPALSNLIIFLFGLCAAMVNPASGLESTIANAVQGTTRRNWLQRIGHLRKTRNRQPVTAVPANAIPDRAQAIERILPPAAQAQVVERIPPDTAQVLDRTVPQAIQVERTAQVAERKVPRTAQVAEGTVPRTAQLGGKAFTAQEIRYLKQRFGMHDVTPAQMQELRRKNNAQLSQPVPLINSRSTSSLGSESFDSIDSERAVAGQMSEIEALSRSSLALSGLQKSPEDLKFLRNLGITKEDIANITPQDLAELKGEFSPGEEWFLKAALGLDADEIKGITRDHLKELRGDKVKLTVQEKEALKGMGFSNDEVSKITREELGEIMQAISANDVKPKFW
jgi:hypothetical protein